MSSLKIFYFWPEYDNVMCQWQRIHIFDDLRHHGIDIETFDPLSYISWDEANQNALIKVKNGGYDVFMTTVYSSKALYKETLIELKKLGIPTLWFRPDNLVIPYVDKDLAPFFDLIWLTAKETRRFYERLGARTVFAPYAANPYNFIYKDKSLIRKVCFIGTPYGSRTRMMNDLLSSDVDFSIFYGKSKVTPQSNYDIEEHHLEMPSIGNLYALYNDLFFKEGRKLLLGIFKNKMLGKRDLIINDHLYHECSVPLLEICDIYSEYVLSLASTSALQTDVLKKPLKIINLRNFEIPMSGGIEICKFNQELADYYEDGKEIVFYNTKEELVDKARYYTTRATDTEIKQIKKAARKRSENEHTWYHRFKKVLGELNILNV